MVLDPHPNISGSKGEMSLLSSAPVPPKKNGEATSSRVEGLRLKEGEGRDKEEGEEEPQR